MIQVADLQIDRERYLVTVHGQPVQLTFMEFNALWVIVEHAGRVVSYDALAQSLWGKPVPHARRRLAVIISRIRSKLGEAADVIDTVTRVGYRLAPRLAA
ncbi:MAG: winged helix family transcriptional regulator [Chloroflexi bacterium]|nr:winged helix-turn-helix domain-containing protein [Chloroflexota bacterium]MDA1240009.1 winged helix-turn-helix domain-containing protein [Chloroflexota bacterium]MQC18969.1 winged helix family transcriptional regulator [Chloroflexota bacterium]MQC48536.1 winged helix family transcriptional regulator [Chloroflexota bacterium]